MRVGAELTREPTARYAPIGVHGRPVSDAAVTLKAALLRRFGPAHATCFARPDRDPRDETIGWVADVPGEARRWTDLDPAEQIARAMDLEMYRADLHAYAEALRAQTGGTPTEDTAARSLAALLDQAIVVPDESHVHFIGDQPVLSFWGFRHGDGSGVVGLGLVPPGAAPPTPAVAAAPVPEAPVERRSWWRWLLWLLPLLLLLTLLLLWLQWGQGCSVVVPPDMPVPPDADRAALPAPDARPPGIGPDGVLVVPGGPTAPSAAGAGPDATAPVVPGAATEPPTPPIAQEPPPADPSAEPPATPPDTPPDTPPMPEAAEAPSPPGPPLEIPPDAARTGDVGFLDGQWKSRRGLVDNVTGEPLEQLYRFGPDGAGETIVRRSDGVECRAPARGRFVDGQLVLEEEGSLTCPDGRTYDRAVTECTRTASGVTACRGVNPDGTGYRVGLDKME